MKEYGFTITNTGRDLLTKILTGSQLTITKVMVGNGKLSGQDPAALTDLVSPKHPATATVPKVTDGTVTFTIQYQNQETGMVTINEYGVFAQDPDAGEILLYYATLGDYPQYVMPGQGDIRRFPVSIALSANDVEVNLAFDSSAFISAKDLDTKVSKTGDTMTGRLIITDGVYEDTRGLNIYDVTEVGNEKTIISAIGPGVKAKPLVLGGSEIMASGGTFTNLPDPEKATDAANKKYVDDNSAIGPGVKAKPLVLGGSEIMASGGTFTNLPDPEKATDAANKKYVDDNAGKRTCRFVVGTSTAGWTKKDCDYLCDGTDDQVEIQAAINALPSTGGEVVVLDGTYHITASINVNKNNVTLRGNGNATVLKRMWGSTTNQGVITVSANTCTVRRLKLDGNKTSYNTSYNYSIYLYNSSNSTVTGNTCNNNGANGIYLYNSSNSTVIGNTCSNNSSSGINLYNSSNSTVIGNTCSNNSSSGIYVNSSNNTITENICNNNTNSTYVLVAGIYVNSTVIGNTCSNNSSSGIYVNSSNNTITENICNNNTNSTYVLVAGIYVASSNNTVTGNICNNNSLYGIYVSSSNSTVTGNTCNNNGASGIHLHNSSNNAIIGNISIRGTE